MRLGTKDLTRWSGVSVTPRSVWAKFYCSLRWSPRAHRGRPTDGPKKLFIQPRLVRRIRLLTSTQRKSQKVSPIRVSLSIHYFTDDGRPLSSLRNEMWFFLAFLRRNKVGWWKRRPVAQRHQMVSSSLALLNYSFPICWNLVFFVLAGQPLR